MNLRHFRKSKFYSSGEYHKFFEYFNGLELQSGGNVFLLFLFGQNLKFYFRILKYSKISPKIAAIVKKKFNF